MSGKKLSKIKTDTSGTSFNVAVIRSRLCVCVTMDVALGRGLPVLSNFVQTSSPN